MCHSLSLANGERNNLLSFGARQEMRSAVLMTRNLFGRNHCIKVTNLLFWNFTLCQQDKWK